MSKAPAAADGGTITIIPPNIGRATLTVTGSSPLIVHKFGEKATKMIADKQQGKATAKREAKVPEQEMLACLYADPMPDSIKELNEVKHYAPGKMFKASFVGAARFADAKMTELRGAVFVAEKCPLTYDGIEMREDQVRIARGTTDLRYRPQYNGWMARLDIEYNKGVLTLEEVVNLVNVAGFSQGIGEWRPERNGDFGRFQVTEVTEKKSK